MSPQSRQGTTRLSIRHKLLAAFAIDLLLMMGLGMFAWVQMGTMNERAFQVETRAIPTLRNIKHINDSLTRYRTLQLEYIIHTNPADKSRLVQEMGDVEELMDTYLVTQAALSAQSAGSSPSSSSHPHFVKAWERFVTANHERFLPALTHANTGTVQPAFSRLNPLYQEVMAASRQLAEESEALASDALGDVRTTYESSRYFILTDTFLSLVLSAVVGFFLSATMARRIQRLTVATRAVAEGDLERRVEAAGRDELETLAMNFNHMVKRLKEKRSALDERHRDLLSSLERQRQLTEDLVRRKAAEEEAHRAKSTAEAANQAKSYFLATMSHELRTPLNAILGYAQILHLERSAQQQEAIPELDRILAAGKHLSGLISNILDFSKIEQGRAQLALGPTDVAELLSEVVAIVEPLAKEGFNTLRLELDDDLGIVQADAGKLRQVLFNLLSNAAKFTQQGEITLRAERFPMLMSQDPSASEDPSASQDPSASRDVEAGMGLRFQVVDTGIGIADHEIESIFEPFRQAEDTTTRRFDGTGLGLVVSRQLCHLMGGDVQVESEVGVGSTFTFELPEQPQRCAAL